VKVMIGIDAHKGSHTAAAIDPAENELGQLRVRAASGQVDKLLGWAEQWPERIWAVETAGGLGYLLSEQLLAAGQRVLDVSPKLAARVRLLATGDINKNDPNDARSVAVAALRSPAVKPVAAEDHTAVMKLWAKRHRDLGRSRTQLVCRLHALLCDLVPGGGISKDSNYTQPIPGVTDKNNPPGYDFNNMGPGFAGAGLLAAATNDLSPVPGVPTGCAPVLAAISTAKTVYNNDVPNVFDAFKPTTQLVNVACGTPPPPAPPVIPPWDLPTYIAQAEASGHDVPDKAVIVGLVQTIKAAAVGVPVILPVAQAAFAAAAVAEDIACNRVDYFCNGSDITASVIGNPSLQQAAIPLPVFQELVSRPNPNPCPSPNYCWGSLIGWAQVKCTDLTMPAPESTTGVCETPGSGKLPTPGTAGINNGDNTLAPNKCATGKVVGLSIGYDGDLGFTVNDSADPTLPGPGIAPLVNYHNFLAGPGGSEAPDGIDIEVPIADRPQFQNLMSQLRPNMEVKVCGHWVADMHMLWNELHPMTSLSILPDFTLAPSSPDISLQAGESATTAITTSLQSGPSAPVNLSIVSGLPPGANATFNPATVTPQKGTPASATLTVSNLPLGDYTLTVQGQSQGVSQTTTVNLHVYDYSVALTPTDETVLRGGATNYTVNLSLLPGSSVTGVPAVSFAALGLPTDATAQFTPTAVTPLPTGAASTLSVATAGSPSGSLGDFTFSVAATNLNGTTRSASANLHLYDFNLAVSPSTLQVLTTGSNSYTVAATPAPGSSVTGLPTLSLSIGGLSTNSTGSFSPSSGPGQGFTSTLTITTSNAASSPGVTLTIIATDTRNPEGGSQSSQAVLVVLSPAQAISLVISNVNSIAQTGNITGGQANSLISKLEQVITSLTRTGQIPACNQTVAFINEVNSILPPAQAATLLGGPLGINAIRMAIPC
jgi:hypothetical protein